MTTLTMPPTPDDTTPQPVLAKSRPKVSVLDFPRDALLERITAILAAKGVSRAYLVGSAALAVDGGKRSRGTESGHSLRSLPAALPAGSRSIEYATSAGA